MLGIAVAFWMAMTMGELVEMGMPLVPLVAGSGLVWVEMMEGG